MMDCKKLRELLDAYVDHELSADAATQAEAHMAECRACNRALKGLNRLRQAVKTAAGKPEAPVELMERVRSAVSPRWHRAAAIQAIAATLILAGVLTLFVPGVRGAAATALDYLSCRLDDSRPVVLEGKVLCRDCLTVGFKPTMEGCGASSKGKIPRRSFTIPRFWAVQSESVAA